VNLFTGSASARLKAGLARPAQYDTAAAAAVAAAAAAAAEDQARVSEVLMVGVELMVREVPMVTRAG
jgi:creatinine amidohydrolase/Fe(II)-dependent formamide hydrolase-like protein